VELGDGGLARDGQAATVSTAAAVIANLPSAVGRSAAMASMAASSRLARASGVSAIGGGRLAHKVVRTSQETDGESWRRVYIAGGRLVGESGKRIS
jgi:hypothetical protein